MVSSHKIVFIAISVFIAILFIASLIYGHHLEKKCPDKYPAKKKSHDLEDNLEDEEDEDNLEGDNDFTQVAIEEADAIEDTPIDPFDFIDNMDGHDFEYWCADLLRKLGYTKVVVTPGSGDQGADVIATKDGIKFAFQCKCYSSDLGNAPVQEVNAGKIIYHCHIGIVITNRYFTPGAIQAADATGVILWDRDKLAELIEEAQLCLNEK